MGSYQEKKRTAIVDPEAPTYAGFRKIIAVVLLEFIGRLFRHLAALARLQFSDLPPDTIRNYLVSNIDTGGESSGRPPPLLPSECPPNVEADFDLPMQSACSCVS